MINQEEFAAIAALDLDPIKVKLMHEASGEGWSLEKANAVEAEYRRFLILMKKFPEEQTAPLFDVDTFWHYHILDTLKYAQDCEQVFGYFLHHFPYIGLRGQRMQELYEETFGEPYLRGQAAWSGVAAKTAWSGVAAQSAWSGAPREAKVAWSGAAKDAKVAWSGAASAQSAWSGIASADQFYSVRPSLSQAAA